MPTSDGTTIRIMRVEDYDGVNDLWIHTPGMGLNDIDDSRTGIAAYLRRNPATSFVAEEDGRIVGAILAGHDGRRGFIHHTAVLPACRGRGLGRKLAESAMAALEREGINKAMLVVFARNAAGNGFWEHLGFAARNDLVYRNRNIRPLRRIDT